jgi:GDP-L-fucose synthase
MNKNDKIYIAGHRGMVGSAIMRKLQSEGFTNFVTRTSAELDLRDQQAVAAFFAQTETRICFPGSSKSGRYSSQ